MIVTGMRILGVVAYLLGGLGLVILAGAAVGMASATQLLAVAVIAPQMVAFICRLDALSWSTSRAGPVAFHLAGISYLVVCLGSVLQDDALGPAWVGLAFTALWLAISWPTWRDGPPEHVMTAPAPLDEAIYVPAARDDRSRWLPPN